MEEYVNYSDDDNGEGPSSSAPPSSPTVATKKKKYDELPLPAFETYQRKEHGKFYCNIRPCSKANKAYDLGSQLT